MASHLVPTRWEGKSVFSAHHLIERMGAARPQVHRQTIIIDSLDVLQKLSVQTKSELRNILGFYFLNDPRYAMTVVSLTPATASGCAMLVEIAAELGAQEILHVGSAAGIKDQILPGDILIADAAYRDDGVSMHYLPPGDLVIGDSAAAGKWKNILSKAGLRQHRGALWSSSSLLRATPESVSAFARRGVLGVDADAATALAVAAVRGLPITCLRVVTDILSERRFESYGLSPEVSQNHWRLLELVIKEWR